MLDVALIVVNAICLALIAALGFAVQRANLCTVRAVEEVLNSRSAYMLASFAKAALWAAAIYGAVMLAMLDRGAGFQVHDSLLHPLLGGFVFGVGAGITGVARCRCCSGRAATTHCCSLVCRHCRRTRSVHTLHCSQVSP